jgi:hypothetical protein
MPWDRRQKSQAVTEDVNEHRKSAVAMAEIAIHRFMGIEPFALKGIVNLLPQRPPRKALYFRAHDIIHSVRSFNENSFGED